MEKYKKYLKLGFLNMTKTLCVCVPVFVDYLLSVQLNVVFDNCVSVCMYGPNILFSSNSLD